MLTHNFIMLQTRSEKKNVYIFWLWKKDSVLKILKYKYNNRWSLKMVLLLLLFSVFTMSFNVDFCIEHHIAALSAVHHVLSVSALISALRLKNYACSCKATKHVMRVWSVQIQHRHCNIQAVWRGQMEEGKRWIWRWIGRS